MGEPGLVSAVITTYKRAEGMLTECIESILGQSYQPIEILLVDDNAAATPEKAQVKAVADRYPQIRLISHEVNQGAQRSRNDGIRAARGEFVAFLDDDDAWLPKKIETQLKLFDDPRVGLVYCRGYQTETDLSDHSTPYSSYFRPECTHRTLLAFDDIGTTSQAVIRRSCFEEIGYFDERLPARQDYEMWIRITTKFRAVGSPEFLYVRRMHTQSAQISKSREKARQGALIIYEKYKADYKKEGRTVRALGFWQMGSHQIFEHTWFRKKYRTLALLNDPFIIWRRIHGRDGIEL